MSNLLDLSGKIDPASLAIFEAVCDAAGSLGMPFFVVGATARDIVIDLGSGRPSQRATLDRDFGLRVASWREYDQLKELLSSTGQFKRTEEIHRLLFRDTLLVDFLPFGEITDAKGEIRWPPDEDVVMNMVGFEDAYHAALTVRVRANPPLDILVATTPGLTIMKLISWADRPGDRSRDAVDLAQILNTYLDVVNNYKRLFEAHLDLTQAGNFDYVRAGARLLGRDVARIGKPKTIERISEILRGETADDSKYRLIQAMMAGGGVSDEERRNRFDELLTLLRQLERGVDDR